MQLRRSTITQQKGGACDHSHRSDRITDPSSSPRTNGDDSATVLEARSELWHIQPRHRRPHDSDLLVERTETRISSTARCPYDSVSVHLNPGRRCAHARTMDAEVGWSQRDRALNEVYPILVHELN